MGAPISTSGREITITVDQLDLILKGLPEAKIYASQLSVADWVKIFEAEIDIIRTHLPFLATVTLDQFLESLVGLYPSLRGRTSNVRYAGLTTRTRLLPANTMFVRHLPITRTSIAAVVLGDKGEIVFVRCALNTTVLSGDFWVWDLQTFLERNQDPDFLIDFILQLRARLMSIAEKRLQRARETIDALELFGKRIRRIS